MSDELRELRDPGEGGRGSRQAVDDAFDEYLGPEPGRHHWSDCAYVAPGPHPFTCKHCRFYEQAGEYAGGCTIVDGPYDGGLVGAEDTCRWWDAAPAISSGSPLYTDHDMLPEGPEDEAAGGRPRGEDVDVMDDDGSEIIGGADGSMEVGEESGFDGESSDHGADLGPA